jgi:hypothetical protein
MLPTVDPARRLTQHEWKGIQRMKSAFAFLTVAVVLTGLSGCCQSTRNFLSPHGHCLVDGSCGHCSDCPDTCRSCDADTCDANGAACEGACVSGGDPACGAGCGLCGQQYANPGPPTGAVTYPYYTVRGPRDYFMKSPTPLGP